MGVDLVDFNCFGFGLGFLSCGVASGRPDISRKGLKYQMKKNIYLMYLFVFFNIKGKVGLGDIIAHYSLIVINA